MKQFPEEATGEAIVLLAVVFALILVGAVEAGIHFYASQLCALHALQFC